MGQSSKGQSLFHLTVLWGISGSQSMQQEPQQVAPFIISPYPGNVATLWPAPGTAPAQNELTGILPHCHRGNKGGVFSF